jgi:predicted PhzF superfamily epimerase YddE/YHI9
VGELSFRVLAPVNKDLNAAPIVRPEFEKLLARFGAKFVYVFDVNRKEGRTWDNDGRVEDIATGSAAGPAGAYLVTHGLVSPAQTIEISQGRFVGRPSTPFVVAQKTLKGRLALRSQATLLFSQEVNSRFEASEGRFKSSSSSAGSARAGASGLGVTKTVPCHLALQATDRD